MQKCGEYGYRADKGMHFVATEVAKEWASYRNCVVGEPLDSDDTFAVKSMVEQGAVKEVPDPEWVTLPGYKVVYDYKGNQLCCGNPCVYHNREMAEAVIKNYQSYPWFNHEPYIIDAVYEGKRPKECRKVDGLVIYNRDYWTYNREPGCYVEEEIAMDCANCVPPRTYRSGMIQCGEVAGGFREGETYATFIKVADGIWKWCGNCFAGESETAKGTPIPYVV